MGVTPDPHPSLLRRLRDVQDRAAWSQFVDVYAPMIYRYARQCGLHAAGAADLTRHVLQTVSLEAQRPDGDLGSQPFQRWLFRVVRGQLEEQGGGPGLAPDETPTDCQLGKQAAAARDPESLWRQVYERQLLVWAARQVRERIEETAWQAFWQTSVEGRDVQQAADRSGMTVAAVYMARSRVIGHLKEQIQELQ